MKITFLGTKGNIEESSDKHRYNASLLVETDKGKFIIDYGGEHARPFEDLGINEVVLTHTHPDHVDALPRSFDGTLYAHPEVLQELEHFDWGKQPLPATIAGVKVSAIPVKHSSRVFTTGILLSHRGLRVLYTPDILEFEDPKVLRKVKVWITDAAHPTRTIRRRGDVGHMSMKTALRLAEEYNVPHLVFTHFGKRALDVRAEDFPSGKVHVMIAKDGLVLNDEELFKAEALDAVLSLLLAHKRYTEFVPKHLSLIDVIRKTNRKAEPKQLTWLNHSDVVAFIDLRQFPHEPEEVKCTAVFISDAEPQGDFHDLDSGLLYLFSNKPFGADDFELRHTLFAFDIDTYDPSDKPIDELREKWAHLLAWYAAVLRNKPIKFTKEQLENFAERLLRRLIEEGSTTFHWEAPSHTESELLEAVLPRIVKKALYVPAPYANGIAHLNIHYVVHDKELPHGEFLALTDRTWHYGYVRLRPGTRVSADRVDRYGWDNVERLFPNARTLYVHELRDGYFFNRPRRLHRRPKRTLQEFRGGLDALYYGEFVELPEDLERLTDLELVILHSRAHEAYRVDPARASELHRLVVSEMLNRGMQHRFVDTLDDQISPTFDKFVKLETVLANLPEKITVWPARVKLFGSLVANGFGNDIDVHVEEGDPRFERGLTDQLPHDLAKRVHIADEGAPFAPYLAVYDLAYVRCKPANVQYEQQAMFAQTPEHIKPFTFFPMAKTFKGYHKAEYFDVKDAIEMLEWGDDHAYLAEYKADGVNVQIHKQGDQIRAWTEDGREIDLKSKFPALLKALQKINHDFVICGELMSWPPLDRKLLSRHPDWTPSIQYKGHFHLGRGDLIGYLHSRGYEEDVDKHARLMVYDIVWLDGEDIHMRPLEERIKLRDKLFPSEDEIGSMLFHPLGKIIRKPEELVSLWKNLKRWVGHDAEGLMLKHLGRPYIPKPESAQTGWSKIKYAREITVEVIAAERLKPGPHGAVRYKYLVGVRDKEGKLHPLGWTYATRFRMKPGDVAEVQLQELSKYTDPRSGYVWYAAYRMVVKGPRPERGKPDDVETAEKLVRVSKGQVGEKPLPADIRRHLQEAGVTLALEEVVSSLEELYEALDDIDALEAQFSELDWTKLPYPSEARKWQLSTRALKRATNFPKGFFVFQLHGVPAPHIDFRYKVNGVLNGWTFFIVQKGALKNPIDTLEEAHEYAEKIRRCDTSFTKFHPCMTPQDAIQCTRKSSMDVGWLKMVDEVLPPGRVGSTKTIPGVFVLVDCGLLRQGADKPWFKEYFLYGKYFDRKRLVIRAVPGRQGGQEVFWIARLADPTPYIFTPRARQQGYAPSYPAIPIELEKVIPEEMRWWGKPLSEAERRKRIDAAYNYLIEKGILKARPLKANAEFAQETKGKFVLHRIWWKGQTVVRNLPNIHYRLRLYLSSEKPFQFVFEHNPLTEPEVFGKRSALDYKPPKGDSWLDYEGEIPPQHPENPNKSIPAHAEILDSGEVLVIDLSEVFIGTRMKGKELNGYYVFKREDPRSPFWLFKKSPELEHM